MRGRVQGRVQGAASQVRSKSLSPSRIASPSFVGTSEPSGLGASGKRTDEGLRAGAPRFCFSGLSDFFVILIFLIFLSVLC